MNDPSTGSGTDMKMDWISEIEYTDLLSKDAAMIYDACGEDVLFSLLLNMPGITFYTSEKILFEMKKRYIRKFHGQLDAKQLAVKLGVSEKFVYNAIAGTDIKDDRQGSLL
jgi:hypothetical protein